MRALKNNLPLIFALAVAALLAVAAYGKYFYPAESLEPIECWVSLFEVLLLVAILIFRNQPTLWLFSAVIFGGWCGYALFWYFVELPCSCMGEMLKIPTGLSVSLDVVLIAMSLFLARYLLATGKAIYFSFLAALMASLVGYSFGDWVFKTFVANS